MPAITESVTVDAPLGQTWDFVKVMQNWAELLPGFEGMTVLSETDSEWKVRGDVGILTKLVTMQVHITDWADLAHVKFSVVCKEEPLTATGALIASTLDADRTTLDFELDAHAGGMLGPVVNALLKNVMPRMAADFAGSIKREVEGRSAVADPRASDR
jgi:carbon monoxide dehydrogenase subunit G